MISKSNSGKTISCQHLKLKLYCNCIAPNNLSTIMWSVFWLLLLLNSSVCACLWAKSECAGVPMHKTKLGVGNPSLCRNSSHQHSKFLYMHITECCCNSGQHLIIVEHHPWLRQSIPIRKCCLPHKPWFPLWSGYLCGPVKWWAGTSVLTYVQVLHLMPAFSEHQLLVVGCKVRSFDPLGKDLQNAL